MSLYQNYSGDEELETKSGVRVAFQDEVYVIMRRAGGRNKRYAAEMRKLTQPIRRQIANDTVEPEKLDEIFMRLYAQTVVVGWENVTDENDQPLDFNEANFVKVMKDLPDFWTDVQAEATKISNFRRERIKEDGELLGNSSFGISSGERH